MRFKCNYNSCRSVCCLNIFVYADLVNEKRWIKSEYVDKLEFCQEFSTAVQPDASVSDVRDFRGLIFSIY